MDKINLGKSFVDLEEEMEKDIAQIVVSLMRLHAKYHRALDMALTDRVDLVESLRLKVIRDQEDPAQ